MGDHTTVVRKDGGASCSRAVSEEFMKRLFPAPSTAVTHFLQFPELFVMPTPLIVSVNPVTLAAMGGVGIRCRSGEQRDMSDLLWFAYIETLVILERPKVAVSAGPLGTPFGVQFPGVFQSPEMESRSHWVLIA